MSGRNADWKGYWAASPTPFGPGGELDTERFQQVLRYFLDAGVHGLLVNGSSGEWFAQSHAERCQVAETAISVVAQAVPVLIGCTALRSAEAIGLAEHARSAGAAGILISPPPYLRLSPDDVVTFFEFIASQTALPVMVYNIPRRSGTAIDPETARRLAGIEGIVAIKNSVPDTEFFAILEAVTDQILLFGGSLFTPRGVDEILTGRGAGYIGGWELLGSKLPGAFEAAWRGDAELARSLAAQERALDEELWDVRKNPRFGRSFQSQLKAALELMNVPAGLPRLPLLPLDDPGAVQELALALRKAGIAVRE